MASFPQVRERGGGGGVRKGEREERERGETKRER
jgi:hypothetical protein